MAGQKISQLLPASSLIGDELIPMAKDGANSTTTPAQLKSFMVANSANIYGYVTAYADLPLGTAISDPEIGDLVGVNTTTGTWILTTQRRMGFYKRVAVTGVASADYGTSPYAGFPASAAELSFTPAGDITSVQTQAAIEELDTEKAALDSDELEFCLVSSYLNY